MSTRVLADSQRHVSMGTTRKNYLGYDHMGFVARRRQEIGAPRKPLQTTVKHTGGGGIIQMSTDNKFYSSTFIIMNLIMFKHNAILFQLDIQLKCLTIFIWGCFRPKVIKHCLLISEDAHGITSTCTYFNNCES